MKAKIHPQWYPKAKIRCTCGNQFTAGSTKPKIKVEICSACHPFFTGESKYIDTLGRVEKFEQKRKSIAGKKYLKKSDRKRLKAERQKEIEKKRPKSFKEALQGKKQPPMEAGTAIVEVKAGTGGDEAKIWAQDLLRMYLKFAEKQGWQTKLIGKNILRIKGAGPYNKLKFESGVHRVQRVPVTEKYGRIHTSTATVVVLPEIPVTAIDINPSDLKWQFFRASTQGGQNVQKVSSAVRLTHQPTGISVTCEQERTQEQNRQIALQLLRSKLWQREEEKRQININQRRSIAGTGRRSEKIRTYNFPHNRITDHRLNKKFHNLESILNGNLEVIVNLFTP